MSSRKESTSERINRVSYDAHVELQQRFDAVTREKAEVENDFASSLRLIDEKNALITELSSNVQDLQPEVRIKEEPHCYDIVFDIDRVTPSC